MKVQTTSWINMDTYSSDPVQTDFRKPFWVWPWWTYQVKLGCVYGFLRPPRTCVDNCPPMSNGHLKPSDMKPFQHEVLQTWTPWTFTFKHGTHRTWRHSSLQTWSHQHDNPRKDASKHEANRHEALQTWSPSNMMPSKQFTKSILIRSTNRLSSSSQMNEDCNVQLGIQGPIAVLRLHFKLPLPFEFESLSGVLL